MKATRKGMLVRMYTCLIAAAIVAMIPIGYWWFHPHLTEMQLFQQNPAFIVCILFSFVFISIAGICRKIHDQMERAKCQ